MLRPSIPPSIPSRRTRSGRPTSPCSSSTRRARSRRPAWSCWTNVSPRARSSIPPPVRGPSKAYSPATPSPMPQGRTSSWPPQPRRSRALSSSLSEKQRSRVAQIIHSLPAGASSTLQTLNPEIAFSEQPRRCDCCAAVFLPNAKRAYRRFCGQRCSTRWWMQFPEFRARVYTPERAEKCGAKRKAFLASGASDALQQIARFRAMRPSLQPEVRAAISARLVQIGHKPKTPGGNGRPTAAPQRELWMRLGPGWHLEHIVRTGRPPKIGPTHYKLDIANPEMMVAIEVDGGSHCTRRAQAADKRKDQFLISIGWTVLRFSNREILDWIATETPTGGSVSTIFRQHGILPSAWQAA